MARQRRRVPGRRWLCALAAACMLAGMLPAGAAAEQPAAQPVSWLLDPGHGGSSRGAAGDGHQEKEDALQLALAVGRILEANGQKVGYTRTTDVTMSLEERVEMQKTGGYTFFVSLHRNAANREARGFEIHTFTEDGPGSAAYLLAEGILHQLREQGLVAASGGEEKEAFRDRGIKQSNFHVLRETSCPAILIEAGFIDTQEDNRLFERHFHRLAAAIAAGCLEQAGVRASDVTQPSEQAEEPAGPLRWLAILGAAVLGLAGAACIGFAVLLLISEMRRRHMRRG